MLKWKGLSAAVLVWVLAGCASSGTNFEAVNLPQFEPGSTTTAEATALLGAPPVQTIMLADGGTNMVWRYITSSGFTGETTIKEASLVFNSQGRFVRVFQLVNIPLSDADRQRLQPVSAVTQ